MLPISEALWTPRNEPVLVSTPDALSAGWGCKCGGGLNSALGGGPRTIISPAFRDVRGTFSLLLKTLRTKSMFPIFP